MADFRAGELDVLVATTVIEVGVDVPTRRSWSSRDADRFGLSQLHQLAAVSGAAPTPWCFLFADRRPRARSGWRPSRGRPTVSRSPRRTSDARRGHGARRRQKGMSDLRPASLWVPGDQALVAGARRVAEPLLAEDPSSRHTPTCPTRLGLLLSDDAVEFLFKS